MEVKRKKSGFTIVELLTVLAIIAMLVGLLIPSLTMVRNIAKETKQKSQFAAIEQALLAFRSDYGDYPPSGQRDETPTNSAVHYCGAQKLAEALLGLDLLGFHPRSGWRADGYDASGTEWSYDPDEVRGDDSLYERVGPYLELTSANAFTLNDFFGVGNTAPLRADRFVLCDSFGAKKVTLPQPDGTTTVVNAGTPILYYKANTYSKIHKPAPGQIPIYGYADNIFLIGLNPLNLDKGRLGDNYGFYQAFYDFITDPKILDTTNRLWPYRADSYILISAGADGLYGTSDDITNFRN